MSSPGAEPVLALELVVVVVDCVPLELAAAEDAEASLQVAP